jgi:hypothetical protein
MNGGRIRDPKSMSQELILRVHARSETWEVVMSMGVSCFNGRLRIIILIVNSCNSILLSRYWYSYLGSTIMMST